MGCAEKVAGDVERHDEEIRQLRQDLDHLIEFIAHEIEAEDEEGSVVEAQHQAFVERARARRGR